jgi:hypothetical protein
MNVVADGNLNIDSDGRDNWIWSAVAIVWFLALCFVPDPTPLSAPEWAVNSINRIAKLSEAESRAIATIVLRATGLFLMGLFTALALSSQRTRWLIAGSLFLGPAIGVLSQRVNYGYFPIEPQIYLALASTVCGALAGMGIRKSRVAVISLVVLLVGLFVWGLSTGISEELNFATRMTGQHILDAANEIPKGDEGFSKIVEIAFEFAADNSHRHDTVLPNQAAILALAVIVGDERVAEVANRTMGNERKREILALRRRIKLRGRNDLARHFWVSAGLTVLSDESRAMAVGITKELMDATAGGSGFSFADLTADRAGNRFAELATRNQSTARRIQRQILKGLDAEDFCPAVSDLPEGLTGAEFQKRMGGLGGSETNEIVADISRRLEDCRALNLNSR